MRILEELHIMHIVDIRSVRRIDMKKKLMIVFAIMVLGMSLLMSCGDKESGNAESNSGNLIKSVSAVEESEENSEISYEYDVQEDGTLSLKRLYSNDAYSKISVPSEIDGNTVSKVNGSLFKNDKEVKKVVLPQTVTEIGKETFYFTSNMEELVINGAIETIGEDAIYGCSSLKTLTFKDGLKTIEKNGIGQCEKLTDVYLPSTVESVDVNNFMLCAKPIKIHVPAGSTTESVIKDLTENNAADIEVVSE